MRRRLATMLALALAMLATRMLEHVGAAAIDVERTYGLFGAIQTVDKTTTVARLLEQCYAGFALNGCEDLNATAGFRKEYAFASQFTDVSKKNQQFCLQCCTKPVPRVTGADETWNLSCPLNDLQRLSVSKGRRTFRFARRDSLEDDGIVECAMPTRTPATYLSGYLLTLWLVERTADFGNKYWRSVVNCSVAIAEVAQPPTRFSEVIRLRSIPTPQERAMGWIAALGGALGGALVLLALPLYNGAFRGQRCLHCGSWLVVVHHMCATCICIGCRLHPPPAKVYVENGDPQREPTEDDDADSEDEDDDDNDDDE